MTNLVWQPTMEFRWLCKCDVKGDLNYAYFKVLQQKFLGVGYEKVGLEVIRREQEEWRDVPKVAE